MQCVEQVNANPDRITETGTRTEVGNLACQSDSPHFGWMRTYQRLVGGIQWLYAALFGWFTAHVYMTGRFYHPESYGKGFIDPEYLDYEWLIFTTALTLLSFSGLIGGYGLVRLRAWVRRWEVAYLIFLSAAATAVAVADLSKPFWNSGYLTSRVLFFIAFALPYVPFLFWTGAIPLGVPGRKKPVSASGGLRDRELDG
jgi:hypothetical protein